jgi:antitoxin component HigA of HigAB toxin-antitoxin module
MLYITIIYAAFQEDATDVKPIKTQRDYRRALKAIEGLMRAKRGTPEGDRLDVLVTLVGAWEAKHNKLDLPDPIAAIKYHMDQAGLTPRDLIRSSAAAIAFTRSSTASGRSR